MKVRWAFLLSVVWVVALLAADAWCVLEFEVAHAHVKAMMLSATSHAIPVVAGEPGFGRWQRLIFLELDEPKERRITFHVFGL